MKMGTNYLAILGVTTVTTVMSCTTAKKEYMSYELYPVRTGSLIEMEYTPEATKFTLWSPTADEVRLMLYEAGEGGHAYETVKMQSGEEGTWTAVVSKDLIGKFYTFNVKIDDKWQGDTPGINARAVGVNGKRAAIIDWQSTNPDGWESDTRPPLKSPADMIIYEMHHRDFSVDSTSGVKNKGKYLALTEHGTMNSDKLLTGIDHLIREDKIVLHGGDMTDSTSLVRIIGEVRPDEIYNLGAQSHVQVSFEAPEYAGDVDALGVLRILEAVRMVGLAETCRIYQASTSELYGRVEEVPQNENTPFHPYSPYAVAKQYGFWIVKEYREAYNMFAVNGILFNHESERRGETFVTRKITLAAGRIACGIQDKLYLGNLDSKRDWGYAKDYVECMWLMLQHDKPEDFVIATGVQHTVREFTTLAFHYVGIELEWQGSGIHEKGINKANGKVVVEVSEAFYRPTDVVNLWGDPTKARTVLGWNPQRTSYEELCRLMAEHDLKLAKAEAVVLKETAE